MTQHHESPSRRELLQTAAGATLALWSATRPVLALPKRPNVLFIMTDQQTVKAISALGNRYVQTPNMDSLAATGVLFEQSYCTSPVCSPSRSSLVTSRMPHETGVPHNEHQNFKADLPNMGSVFREAGYDTAWTGKWHLPQSYPTETAVPGFEYLQPIPRPQRNFNGLGVDSAVADAAIAYLKRKRDNPFLLAVSFHNPHDICGLPKEGYPKPDDGNELPPLPANFTIAPDEPEFITRQRKRDQYGPENTRTVGWSDEQWRYYLHQYYRYVEAVDKQIGRVLEMLRAQEIEEDTLIIFTSDHGEGTAGHKWVVKLMLYDEPTKIPTIVSWKGVTPQRIDKQHLVSGLDILPTICDYAGLPRPEGVRGISLHQLIDTPDIPGRDYLVTQLYLMPEEQGRMLRTQRYKYIVFSMGERPEMLFDMKEDAGETNNLAYEKKMRPVLDEHRALLRQWLKETGDDFTSVPT